MVASSAISQIMVLFLTVALSSGLILWALRNFKAGEFQDYSTSRSLHIGVTPKIGGLALLPSVCLALVAYELFERVFSNQQAFEIRRLGHLFTWIAPASIVYLICFLSDRTRTELPAILRFAAFLFASTVFASLWQTPEGKMAIEITSTNPNSAMPLSISVASVGAYCFVLLSVLAFTNFFNFMDGIDGLAGCMGLIGFSTLGASTFQGGISSHLGNTSLIIGASCLGFLFWNWPKAKVFLGDTGSTFLGFSAAAIGWIGTQQGQWHWSFPFLVFFPFWFDATITLLRRLFRGERVWQAHREHFYQRAVLSLDRFELSARHIRVLGPSIGTMLVSSCVALGQHWDWFGVPHQPWVSIVILLALHAGLAIRVELLYRAARVRAALLHRPLGELADDRHHR